MFAMLQAAIRKELNDFKSYEMEVHEESKQYTRYKNIKSTLFILDRCIISKLFSLAVQ